MTSKRLSKIQVQDANINRIQQNISNVLDFVQLSPLTGPVSLIEIEFTSNQPVVIDHKLGRTPIGFIIADLTAARTIHRNTAFNALNVELHPSGSCTAKILFF